METILILIVIFVCWFVLKEKIDKTNNSIDELKNELRKQHIKPEPAAREEPVAVEPKPEPVAPPKYEPLFAEDDEEEEVIAIPPPLPPLPPSSPPIPPPPPNYEKYIGENLFGKIGILILIAGIGFFVKYAIDKDWINEVARTALGFASGFALLFLAGRLKKKYRTFSSLLAGGSFAVFYVTVAIAYHYYQLFSQPVAFAVLVLTTVLMSGLAVLYDRRELAIIALVGGFIAPFLVSTGAGNYKFLFTYILILNTGMFFLSLRKRWAELPPIGFVATTVVMAVFTIRSFGTYYDIVRAPAGLSVHILIFATCFFLIFILPVLHILKSERPAINRVLLLLVAINNFVYLLFGLYYLRHIGFGFKADGLLTLFIALVNSLLLLWMWKQKQNYKLLIHILLGIVLVFVTLTVPVQMDGILITLLWSAELIALAWLYLKTGIRLYEYGTLAMLILTVLSFLMDCGRYFDSGDVTTALLVTHLFAGASILVVALLMAQYRTAFDRGKVLRYHPWNAILIVLSTVICYYALAREIASHTAGWNEWLKSTGLFTSGYLLGLVFVLKRRFPMKLHPAFYMTVLFFNLLIFAIDSYWVEIHPSSGSKEMLLSWGIALVALVTFVETGRQFFRLPSVAGISRSVFTAYFTVLAILAWLALENLFLNQTGLTDESSAGFSIALSVAGFVQMALGMRLHIRILRKLSLITLGIVLAKLIVIDLWAMPTVGKIIVFIFLGVTLLVLSFLYQKLKGVLFGEDEGKEEDQPISK